LAALKCGFIRPRAVGRRAVVSLPDAKVVMVSDQITDNAPLVDCERQRRGLSADHDGLLLLEMAIPGRGEPNAPRSRPVERSSRPS
jgi:hypothetical protein